MRRTVLLLAVVGVVLAAAGWYVLGAGGADPSTDVEEVAGSAAGTTDASQGGPSTTWTVDQTGSSVSYEIDEVLRGEDVTVVGSTSEVATTVTADPEDLSTLELGEVAVNARTFSSDSGLRDNAVRGRILRTDEPANELVTFVPSQVRGLPDAADGSAFEVEVTGQLTVAGTRLEQTVPLAVAPEGDALRVTGETTVSREAYGLEIPAVPFVAAVPDEVLLRLDLLLVPS